MWQVSQSWQIIATSSSPFEVKGWQQQVMASSLGDLTALALTGKLRGAQAKCIARKQLDNHKRTCTIVCLSDHQLTVGPRALWQLGYP